MVKQRKLAQTRESSDALTGDRNEFIGSPVMSGEQAGASGASRKLVRKTPAKARAQAGNKTPRSKADLSLEVRSGRKKAVEDEDVFLKDMSDGADGAEVHAGGGVVDAVDGVESDSDGGGEAADAPVAAGEGTRSLQALPDGRLGVYQDEVLVGIVGPVKPGDEDNEGGEGSPSASPSPSWSGSDDGSGEGPRGEGAESEVGDDSAPVSSAEAVRRRLVSARVDPLGREERPAFADYVLGLADDLAELDSVSVVNTVRRKHACTRLIDFFRISKLEAERLLKISHLAHQRFVALDGKEASEHLGLAFLAGRVLHEGERFIGATPTPMKSKVRTNALNPPATPAPTHRQATKVPPVIPTPRSAAQDRTSYVSNRALDKVLQTLRKSLPADMAEATVRALIESNDGLRAGKLNASPVHPAQPDSASKLGRGYRIGEIARADKAYASRVNRLGARANSREAPEADLWPSDRAALFSSPDQDVLRTLRKVMTGRGAYAHLDSGQKLRAMSRLVRAQLHQESLAEKRGQREPAQKLREEGEEREAGQKQPAESENSDSPGDSCDGESQDSRKRGESYQRDSFCCSDSDVSVRPRRAAAGGSSDDDGSSGGDSLSETGGGSDSDDSAENKRSSKDARRVKERKHSANSLGTPRKKSSSVEHVSERRSGKNQLVLLGDEDLPMWKIGSARFKNGFRYESYIHHKQQFDNYKAHRGRFSERTFKSIIHANLIPVVCASCGFRRSRWDLLEDEKLILRIERVLRPSRSTDFAMELKAIKLYRDGEESLQSSYTTFAELFIGKIAEAEDAGKPVKKVVIKAAFKEAVNKELPLKTWLEGDTWRGVSHAHARLLRKLREARSWEAMTKTVLKAKSAKRGDDHEDEDPPAAARDQPRGGRKARKRANSIGSKPTGGGQSRRGARAGKGRVNNTREERGGARTGNKDKLRTWQGLDNRGASWHSDSNLFECFKKPCQAPFCQRCARHGHTAETCRVPDGVEGLNTSGYFQEKRPGKAGPRRPPPKSNSTKRGTCEDEGEEDRDGAEYEHWGGEEEETHFSSRLARRSNHAQGEDSRGPRGRNRL